MCLLFSGILRCLLMCVFRLLKTGICEGDKMNKTDTLPRSSIERNAMIELHVPYAQTCVHIMYVKGQITKSQVEDCISVAYLTLCTAIDTYDETRCDKFEPYLQMRIKTDVLRYLEKEYRQRKTEIPSCSSKDEHEIAFLINDAAYEQLIANDMFEELLQNISCVEQRVLKLYVNNFSIAEISIITGRSERQIYTCLQNIRKYVKRKWVAA